MACGQALEQLLGALVKEVRQRGRRSLLGRLPVRQFTRCAAGEFSVVVSQYFLVLVGLLDGLDQHDGSGGLFVHSALQAGAGFSALQRDRLAGPFDLVIQADDAPAIIGAV